MGMGGWLTNILLFLGAMVAMEGAAWIIHRTIMHGPLWVLHSSHHHPRRGVFERNDLFAVLFSLPAMIAIYLGLRDIPWLLPVGFGMSAYGLAYFLVHDVIIHRRLDWLPTPRSGYLARLHEAHMLHHSVRGRDNTVSYGFLYAPSIAHLRALLSARHRSAEDTPPSGER